MFNERKPVQRPIAKGMPASGRPERKPRLHQAANIADGTGADLAPLLDDIQGIPPVDQCQCLMPIQNAYGLPLFGFLNGKAIIPP
ncbi:hypothetical protein, partial [Thiolapillus sp.]|uniref:hypothetical protein n=1 Tax=Thiolapillus sp. TaxID=2017437 RepID=UPI003AF561E4